MLYLEQLPSFLISPQEIIRQSHNSSDSFCTHRDASKLIFHRHTKTAHYYLQKNIPTLFTESGIDKLRTLLNNNDSLIQDGGLKENLTHGQRQLIYCHLYLVDMGMEKIKTLPRKGLLPK